MTSEWEQQICICFRALLSELPIGDMVVDFELIQKAVGWLDYFLPQAVIGEVYPEWKYEAFDGIIPVHCRKTGEMEIEILGYCYLMADQSIMPIHLKFQLHLTEDEISWMECRIGEKGEPGLERMHSRKENSMSKRLYMLIGQENTLNWQYKAGFGTRVPSHN